MNVYGFSLIELIVVIAIVGILSTVAVSTYKQYSLKANLTSIVTGMESLVKRAQLYADSHDGRFPSAYDLGLTSTVDGQTVSSDIAEKIMGPGGSIGIFKQYSLDKVGFIDGSANLSELGYGDSDIWISTFCNYWQSHGVWYNKCFYDYGEADSITDPIMDVWMVASTGNGWDESNKRTYMYCLPSYIDATGPGYPADQSC